MRTLMARFGVLLPLYVCLNLAFSSVVLSTFPAPTNVSVTCHNFKNVLYWNYSEPDLQPKFYIEIRGYDSEPLSVHTSQTYLDISEYTQNADSEYYITVNAQPKESEDNISSKAVWFSYSNEVPISEITCVVDFPVLNVSVLPHKVELSFSHPYHVYNVKSLDDDFQYTTVHNKTNIHKGECSVEHNVCTAYLNLFESIYERCIDVHIKGSVNGIETETDQKVCGHVAPNTTDWTWLLTILLCSVFGLLFVIILGAMIFKKLTQPDPQSTIFGKILGMMNSDHAVHMPEQPVLTRVTSVGQTPLLEATNETIVDLSSPTFGPPDLPTHLCTDVMFSEEQDPEEVTDDTDSGGFSSGNSFSGYDSQKFPIDMGQGDIVEAYGPR